MNLLLHTCVHVSGTGVMERTKLCLYCAAFGSEGESEPSGAAAHCGLQNAPAEEHADPEPDQGAADRERPGQGVLT